MEYNLIQSYIKELNDALKEVSGNETIEELKKLMQLEIKFTKRLRSVAGGKQAYKDFITYIVEERDLREARPYFRERLDTYKDTVNPAIKKRKPEILHKLKMNFLFCSFAMERKDEEGKSIGMIGKDAVLDNIYIDLKTVRAGIIHKHLHYALNKAKIFNRGIGHIVDFGDLIQIANEALIIAVDKYVIDDNSSPFHTMAIGRMISHLISSGDQALSVAVGGQASRRLYQIRKLLEKTPGLNTAELAAIIKVAEEEISLLINAVSIKSLDEPLDKEGSVGEITLKDFLPSLADEHNDPYLYLEKKDLLETAAQIFQTLTLLEQKALRLKGVNFKDYI